MSPIPESQPHSTSIDRYRRQSAFGKLGKIGQERLRNSRIAIVGVGALGSVIAERLGRMGIGSIRLIDRDWVEWDNLPRQALFTEKDAHQRLPKAVAAEAHLTKINSDVVWDSHVSDLISSNALELLSGFDLILDGTDNFETRFLINDVSLELGIPWVHGGCIGATGQVMAIVPGVTACFRCLMPDPPPADQMATCDSAGVLGPSVSIVASWQAMEAVKILVNATGDPASRKDMATTNRDSRCELMTFDLWSNEVRKIFLSPVRPPEPMALATGDVATERRLIPTEGCPACFHGRRDFLHGDRSSLIQVLCGRNAVQIQSASPGRLDLVRLADRLRMDGKLTLNAFLLRFETETLTMSVFTDGRAIVAGTEDPAVARRFLTKWLG
jgi:adenylyltransferase/sulfurtransferase